VGRASYSDEKVAQKMKMKIKFFFNIEALFRKEQVVFPFQREKNCGLRTELGGSIYSVQGLTGCNNFIKKSERLRDILTRLESHETWSHLTGKNK